MDLVNIMIERKMVELITVGRSFVGTWTDPRQSWVQSRLKNLRLKSKKIVP